MQANILAPNFTLIAGQHKICQQPGVRNVSKCNCWCVSEHTCDSAGNGGSLEKCRRRWDLVDADYLKYKFMNTWDRAIQHLDKAFGFVSSPHEWVSRKVSSLQLPANLYTNSCMPCSNPSHPSLDSCILHREATGTATGSKGMIMGDRSGERGDRGEAARQSGL